MKQFTVTGMSCAACSARVEKAVSNLEGVESCSVSLLTNSLGVEGTVSDEAIIKAVERAGYGVKTKEASGRAEASFQETKEALEDTQSGILLSRLIRSVVLLLVLMYISMGHMMWSWPLPYELEKRPLILAILQCLLTLVILWINRQFFRSGIRSTLHGAPNMDTLVALGAGVSFLYSAYRMAEMFYFGSIGNEEMLMHRMHDLYFESAAMIVTLITIGKLLESVSKGKTTSALKSLLQLSPKKATLLVDGEQKEVEAAGVQVGDIFLVRPGESIPVDGFVLEGSSAVNEAALTGESVPVDKNEGDTVSAATLNQSGFLKCKATRVGKDTTLAQIIQMVSDAAATKAPIAKVADKVSGIFVPVVILIAAVVFGIWMLLGAPVGFSVSRAIAVLVISCPCALGLATPVAIMVGNGRAARAGILFKTSAALEETGRLKTILFDKTGTITRGEPEVTDVFTGLQKGEQGEAEAYAELLSCAASLEERSEHPLAKAVLEYIRKETKKDRLEMTPLTEFEALPGNGLRGRRDRVLLRGGNLSWMSTQVMVSDAVKAQAERFAEEGKTPMLFARDQHLLGIIAVADVLKEDSADAVQSLKKMGIYTVMLTGDNARTAKAIGALAGVDEVISDVLPGEKEAVVQSFRKNGKTAMVGDGINDAPALTSADVGIAIGAGTDVAIDAADVVLAGNKISDVITALRLSRATLRNIHENLFWAFFYNIICIPLAAGVYIGALGISFGPMVAAAAMSLSSFCVVMNALRLNLVRLD